MLQKLILVYLIFSLVGVNATTQIHRDSNDDLLDNSAVSNMPYGFYQEKLEAGTYKVLENEDFSEFADKEIFVGYGVFDKNDKTCKYIENEENKNSFTTHFDNIFTFGANTFAVSRAKKTYAQCLSLVNNYVGTIYAPKNSTESIAISKEFKELDTWIGLSKENCNSEYKNGLGLTQSYKNFIAKNSTCSDNALNIIKPANTTQWKRGKNTETHYCPIRIDSNDYKKPIKLCAPFWRLERTYKNEENNTLVWGDREIDLNNLFLPDVPARLMLCTQIKEIVAADLGKTKRTECQLYYDRKAGGGKSGQCMHDPIQADCQVNQCRGYIENNCKKVDKLIPFKDYTKGVIEINGEMKTVKMLDKIVTYIYECPLINPSIDNCLNREEVVLFPMECPNSRCDNLKVCIQSGGKTAKECMKENPCEKVYGDVNRAPIYNEAGKIIAVQAQCKVTSNEIIENTNIRQQNYSKSICLEYAENIETNTSVEKCLTVNNKVTRAVEASITAPDVYQDDPQCVRMNNIEDARPYVDVVFEYQNRGFFTTVIKKAYIDGETDRTIDLPEESNQLASQIPNLRSNTYDATGSQEAANEEQIVTKQECDTYFNSDSWFENRIGKLFSSHFDAIGVVQNSQTRKVAVVVNANSCSDTASLLGYQDISNTVSYTDFAFEHIGIDSEESLKTLLTPTIAVKHYCVLDAPRLSGDDIFKSIDINVANETFTMHSRENVTSELQCQKYSECLDTTSTIEEQSCVLNPKEEEPIPSFNPSDGEYFDFVEQNGSLATKLDGTKDIIVIEEYTPGRFGYMSNYRFQLPKNNIIKLNNKEIFPLIPNAAIEEDLTFNFNSKTYKQKTKNRNPSVYNPYFETLSFGVSNGGSSSSGGFIASFGLGDDALTVIGLGVPIIGLIMLFSGTKSFGTLQTDWNIQKTLPIDREHILNPYGYDFREYNSLNRVFTYERTKFGMATLRSGNYNSTLNTYVKQKKSSLYFSGYSHSQISNPLITKCEQDGCTGYPGGFKWYKFSGHNNAYGESIGTKEIDKPVNTIYMGATNTVSIFVPYMGSYEVVALDKYENIIGRHIVDESEFYHGNAHTQDYAKVMFSLSNEFQLANGMIDGDTNGACRFDDFTEWGGGVSGAYYEDGTPNGNLCAKSNDKHVQAYAAHYLKIRPVDSNKFFKIKLEKPMPYANRFFLVQLGKLEERIYECYTEGAACTVE